MTNSSIWFIDRTLSGDTPPGKRSPGSDGNEGVLRIPQCSSIIGAFQSDCLVSYLGHSFEESQQRWSRSILRPQPTGLYITEWKLLIFDRNTLNHKSMGKLFVFYRNTWNHITVQTICNKNNYRKLIIIKIIDRGGWRQIDRQTDRVKRLCAFNTTWWW